MLPKLPRLLSFSLIAITAAFVVAYAIPAKAMDFETSVNVASCPNRPGFEKDGKRTLALLHRHKIKAELSYYEEDQGIKALTEDIKHSTGWIIYVLTKDAPAARNLIAEAIKKGLHVVVLPASSPQ